MIKSLSTRGVLAAVVLVAVSTAGVGLASDSSDPISGPLPPFSANGPVDRVAPEMAAAFSIFRSQPESAPAQVAADFANLPIAKEAGLNVALAQAVATPASDSPVWVVPGDGWACIWIKDPVDGAGISCDPDERILKRGLMVELVRSDREQLTALAGVVPDGTGQVTLIDSRGAREYATSASGVFGARDVSVRSVSFVADGKATTVTLQHPGR